MDGSRSAIPIAEALEGTAGIGGQACASEDRLSRSYAESGPASLVVARQFLVHVLRRTSRHFSHPLPDFQAGGVDFFCIKVYRERRRISVESDIPSHFLRARDG